MTFFKELWEGQTQKAPAQSIADYAFLIIDLEKVFTPAKHENTNRKISVIADDFRALGMDIFWITFPVFKGIKEYLSKKYYDPKQEIYIAKPDDKDVGLSKQSASAFKGDLESHIGSKTHLIVAGYASNCCALETIVSGLKKGYNVTFLYDCTDYHEIDFADKRIDLHRIYVDSYNFARLQLQYPGQFHMMTHMEFFEHLAEKTGKRARLLDMSEKLFKRTRKSGEPWRWRHIDFCSTR